MNQIVKIRIVDVHITLVTGDKIKSNRFEQKLESNSAK